jgi:hypothetical protein
VIRVTARRQVAVKPAIRTSDCGELTRYDYLNKWQIAEELIEIFAKEKLTHF